MFLKPLLAYARRNTTDVTLQPPSAQYRKVIVQGLLVEFDDACAGGGEHRSVNYYSTCTVGPNPGEQVASLSPELDQQATCIDHVGVKIDGTCTWQTGGAVKVDLAAGLYVGDSNSCGGGILRASGGSSVVAPPNGKQTWSDNTIEMDANGSCDWPFGDVTNTGEMDYSATNVVAD